MFFFSGQTRLLGKEEKRLKEEEKRFKEAEIERNKVRYKILEKCGPGVHILKDFMIRILFFHVSFVYNI